MENSPNNSSRFLDESGEHLTNDALNQFIHSKENLSNEDKVFIENHLADCPDCSKNFYAMMNEPAKDKTEAEEETIDFSEDDDIVLEEEPVDISGAPPPVQKMAASGPLQRNPKFWLLAVGLLLIIFIWFFFLSSDETETDEIIDSENPEMMQDIEDDPVDVPEEDLPPPPNENQPREETPENQEEEEDFTMPDGDSFAENPVYEEMIMINRSMNGSISLNEPAMGETMGTPLHFHWQKPENIRYVQLIVITNKGKSVYNSTLGGNEITIDKKLAAGLYYVKVSAGSGNEALGKFYVR